MAIQSNFPNLKPTLLLDFANTKALDGRITFTRSTTATFYDGVTTAKAEENLILQSQDFATTWAPLNATITANTTAAPDGTTTADTLLETAVTGVHYVGQSVSGTTTSTAYTISAYVKPNGRDWVVLEMNGASTYACFDVTNGVVGTTLGSPTTSITAVGNGWYRCVVTKTIGSAITAFRIYAASADNTSSYAGDITKGLFLWGAQLEQRSSVTAYTATTTQAITNYIPVLQTAASGVPRFDHNPVTDESLGLLIEEQRTNLLTYSAQFDNAAWTKSGTTITADANVAPDGTLTADRLVENTAASQHQIIQAQTLTAASYTFSVYAKAASGSQRWLNLYPQGTGVTASAIFDINSGTVTASSGAQLLGTSITSVGNGWYRCAISFTGAAVSVSNVIYLANSSNTASPGYTGDGWSGAFIWGAQLEAGSFATSYIPTVASTVTRNADAASMTGTNFSSWFSAPEGTLYAESQLLTTVPSTTNFTVAAISDGTTNNFILMRYAVSTTQMQFAGSVAGVSQWAFNNGTNLTTGAFSKNATVYKFNDIAGVVNNGTVGTDTSATIPVVSQLNIGASGTGTQPLNSTIKKIAYYPLRVTNAQLQALTS